MIYRNKLTVALNGMIYPVNSKWDSGGNPYILSMIPYTLDHSDVLELDDIKPTSRVTYFKEYPSEEFITKELLAHKLKVYTSLEDTYRKELLLRQKYRLRELKKGAEVDCLGVPYFFEYLHSTNDGDVVAVCNCRKKDGSVSKTRRVVPLRTLVVINGSDELNELLKTKYV